MKKKTTKRMLSLLLAVVMICSLAGCGDKKVEESKTPSSSTPSSTESSVDEGPKEYVPEEELKLTIWNAQGTDFIFQNKIEDNVVADYLYDKTLVSIGNMYGNDGGSWDVKLSRLIAGDNMPHMIYVSGGNGAPYFAKLREADQIWGITEEMLKEYAPNYYERIPKEALDAFLYEGKYYGLPFGVTATTETAPTATQEDIDHINTYVAGVSQSEYMEILVRDDVLTAIYPDAMTWADIEEAYDGAPMAHLLRDVPINTTQDLVDFFYAVKELGAKSLNGKTVYAYGYGGSDCWDPLCYVGGTLMGYAPHYYTGCWNPVTEEINILLDDEILKEGAKIQNQMIIDQVIDPESLIQTNEMYKEKVNNGQYAMFAQGTGGAVTLVNAELEKQGADFRYRPLYTLIPTAEGHEETKSVRHYIDAICLVNTLEEEEMIQVLNWLNVQCSEEFGEVFWWGTPEDGLYVENADGTRSFKEEAMNQRFLENNAAALADTEAHGIGVNGFLIGEFVINFTTGNRNKWMPIVYNRVKLMSLQNAVWIPEPGYESIVTKVGPKDDGWEGLYAQIPEVIAFWAEREPWENAFKLALASEDAEQFEKRWAEALDVLNDVCDVKAMEQAMTEAAKASME